MCIFVGEMKKTILLAAALLAALGLSAQTIRTNYRSEGMTHISTQSEKTGDLDVIDRKSTRLNSSHSGQSRMPSSA